MQEILTKAASLLEACETAVLASVNENGFPRPVPMSKVRSEGASVLWFATGTTSRKTKHFTTDPKTGVCCHAGMNSAAMAGTVGIFRDAETRHACWKPEFLPHFPEGPDDPEYCVLKFTATEGTFWIDGEFVTCEL